MGKAVVFGFFFIGFIIFTFFKHASKGIKQAYKAVNDETPLNSGINQDELIEDEAITVIKEAIKSTLEMQFQLGGYNQIDNPETDFAVGYVIGYVDAFCQLKNLDDAETFEILTNQFFNSYGHEKGLKHVGFYMKNQNNLSKDMTTGIKLGGTDVFSWLTGSEESRKRPSGLKMYLQDNKP